MNVGKCKLSSRGELTLEKFKLMKDGEIVEPSYGWAHQSGQLIKKGNKIVGDMHYYCSSTDEWIVRKEEIEITEDNAHFWM